MGLVWLFNYSLPCICCLLIKPFIFGVVVAVACCCCCSCCCCCCCSIIPGVCNVIGIGAEGGFGDGWGLLSRASPKRYIFWSSILNNGSKIRYDKEEKILFFRQIYFCLLIWFIVKRILLDRFENKKDVIACIILIEI